MALKPSISEGPEAKKNMISIRNFRGYPTLNTDEREKLFDKLQDGLKEVLDSAPLTIALEEMFRLVENFHKSDSRERLFTILQTIIENYLEEKLHIFLCLQAGDILPYVTDEWGNFHKKIVTIKNIYLWYDRCQDNDLKFNNVQNFCTDCFKNILILNPNLKANIMEDILKSIDLERRGSVIDRSRIASMLTVLRDLSIYNEIFEKDFVEKSKTFYYNKTTELMESENDIRSYLEEVRKCVEEEELRTYLHPDTKASVLNILCKTMIRNHLMEILDRGFGIMMDAESREYLLFLYKVCAPFLKGVKVMASYFQNYVTENCLKMISKPKSMIQRLIDFKDKLETDIKVCFNDDETFYDIIRTSFTRAINSKQNEPAQYLARYLDNKLRSKYVTEDDLEACLRKAIGIFRYIQGKDIFEAFYKKDLAKRLIFGKSTNQDEEYSMISQLKLECGETFTSKVEGMFSDMNICREVNQTFKQFLDNTYPDLRGTDITIFVLTSSFWPQYSNTNVHFPEELTKLQVIFQTFYSNKHSGRKLCWQSSLGYCLVRATFENGNKELQVSLLQTTILLLFNDSEKLSLEEIQESTKMDIKDLKITLHSLACGKTKILLKMPESPVVKAGDMFFFNAGFDDRLFRIKVNQIQLKESVNEQDALKKTVLMDRQFQVDAAIVRILKRKKSMEHNALVGEVLSTLNIPVKVHDLKKRIEKLVDREYLKRELSNPVTYTYIA